MTALEDRKIVVAGGTGLLGRALIQALSARGARLQVVSRKPDQVSFPSSVVSVPWEDLSTALEGAYGVVNLAGASLADGRWSATRRKAILESRVSATRRIVEAVARCRQKPQVLLNASAIGYYGDRGLPPLDEGASAGSGFLPEVCAAWEAEAERATLLGLRVVRLRTGVVLSARGGALRPMVRAVRGFAGSVLGDGTQGMSWIHEKDWTDLAVETLVQSVYQGPVNATAPHPVSHRVFMKHLAKQLRRPLWPVPSCITRHALRLMMGEMADALILQGAYVFPGVATTNAFPFSFTRIEDAFADLLA